MSYADIFATCLYAAGEGFPLWNPSPLRLGDIGFVREGSFHTLYNCIDGPSPLPIAGCIELATNTGLRRSPRFRSETPTEGPLPLVVEEDPPKLFTMGPRVSSTYRCLGLSFGASIPTSPLGGKISFESTGGDGALLIPRDPTERTLLKHMGVLKAYLKTHRRWIHDTYGAAEDIEVDELALIYGQDRTSDWAVAVSKDSVRGAKVEFEVGGMGNVGFWGSWKTVLSASQRGPYRPGVGWNRELGIGREGEEEVGVSLEGICSVSYKKEGETPPPSCCEWRDETFPPEQSIIIRRVTARTSLGLGFLPTKLKASAEPQDPSHRDHEAHLDPLESLHRWILSHPSVVISIASDEDCLRLLSFANPLILAQYSLSEVICFVADRCARLDIDQDGIATLRFKTLHKVPKVECEGERGRMVGACCA